MISNKLRGMLGPRGSIDKFITTDTDMITIGQFAVAFSLDTLTIDKHPVIAVFVKDKNACLDAFEERMIARGQIIIVEQEVVSAGSTNIGGLSREKKFKRTFSIWRGDQEPRHGRR